VRFLPKSDVPSVGTSYGLNSSSLLGESLRTEVAEKLIQLVAISQQVTQVRRGL
jgi:hypothetical protein